MKTNKRKLGDLGESWACGYLEKNGFHIIARNYATKFGEIDIVAKSPDKTLVFVEVKTMRTPFSTGNSGNLSYPQLEMAGKGDCRNVDDYSLRNLTPEDQLSPRKREACERMAQWYANENPRLISGSGYRLDLIALLMGTDGVPLHVSYYENI
jgi:Holliday junction resolvase-like predicted endonuclease